MNLSNIQSQNTALRIRIQELENEIRYLSQISSTSSKTLTQIERIVNNAFGKQYSGIRSFQIVDKILSENEREGAGLGIRRSLSYNISSQIDEGIIQTLRGLHHTITSILEQHKKSIQSVVKHKPLSTSAASLSTPLIKEVPWCKSQTYQIPAELILNSNIQEELYFKPSETFHVIYPGRQFQYTIVHKQPQIVVVKEQSEIEILTTRLQELGRQNRRLLKQLEYKNQTDSIEFFFEICAPGIYFSANSSEQDADIPITFLIQNEAPDVVDIKVLEDEQGEITMQEDPNLTASVTHKMELPTAPDIFDRHNQEQSRAVRDPLQQSVISFDLEDPNSQPHNKKTKEFINIEDIGSILAQNQDSKSKIVAISVETEAIAEVVTQKENIQSSNQPITQKIVHVYTITEIPVELILTEQDQGLNQLQNRPPSLRQADLGEDALQAQANSSLKERNIYQISENDDGYEHLKASNQNEGNPNEEVKRIVIDWKHHITQIPIELYIQRIVQIPVELHQEMESQNMTSNKPHHVTQKQELSRKIIQVPIEIILIEAISEYEQVDDLADKKRDQDHSQKASKLRIVEIPVELEIESNETLRKLNLLQRVHSETSSASQELIRSLQVEIGNMQNIVVELNQQKQQAQYEIEHKSLNEEILKKKLEDKELALLRKEEQIENIISKHHQNMNLFASYKEEYANFVQNMIKGGTYSQKMLDSHPISIQDANRHEEAIKRISLLTGDEPNRQLLGSQRYDARLPEELAATSKATEVHSKEMIASNSVAVQTQLANSIGDRDGSKSKAHFSILPVQTPTIENNYNAIQHTVHSLEEDLLPSLQTSPNHTPQYYLRLDSMKNMDEQFLMSEEKYEYEYLHKLYEDASFEAQKYRGLYYQTDEVLLQLRAQINDCTLEIQRLQNHINIQAEEIQEKNRKIDDLEEHASECEGRIDGMERRVDKLEEECNRAQTEYQALEGSFAERVGKLRKEIEEKANEIWDHKQECERHKGLYQAQIERLRDEVVSRQDQIQSLQNQIIKKQNKIERLKYLNSDLKKNLAQIDQHEEGDATAIYEQEFLKVKKQFEKRELLIMEQIQTMEKQMQSLKYNLENEHNQRQKLIALNEDLTLRLKEIGQQRLAKKNDNDQLQTKDLGLNRQPQKQQAMEYMHLLVNKDQLKFSDNESFQIRIEHLSRLHQDRDLESCQDHIRGLENLLLQYQVNMKATLMQMEDFLKMVCEYFRHKLLKEQQKGIQYLISPRQSNTANALLTKKIALSIENDRLAKMASIAEKKLQFLWRELVQTPRKINYNQP